VTVGRDCGKASFVFPVEFLSSLNVLNVADDSGIFIAAEFLNQV